MRHFEGLTGPKGLVFLGAVCLVFLLAQCGSSSDEDTPHPAKDMGEMGVDLANASRQYVLKCSVCHGEDGAPVLASAPDLQTSTLSVEERVAGLEYAFAEGSGSESDVCDPSAYSGNYLDDFVV